MDEKTRTGLIAAGVVAAVCIAVALAVFAPRDLFGDPWQECKQVRRWLRENSPEPRSVEVIEWVRRDDNGGNVQVLVKYRGKNEIGGYSVTVRVFTFVNQKIVNSYTYDY